MQEHDVIVVGGGGSGLATALRAAQLGASVLVLEKGERCGGTTALAVGSFTAAGTRMQQRGGIVDSADDHIADVPGFRPDLEERNDDALRAHFLRHAGEAWNWLEGLGLVFQGPMPEPPNRQPRMHNVVPKAHAYISTFLRHLERFGASIRCATTVTGLLREGARITGVSADTPEGERSFGARHGVVLAAGDYPAAMDLLARFKGEAFTGMRFVNPLATGDGQRLVESVGGALVNMDVTYGPELRFPPLPDGMLDRLSMRGPLGWLTRLALPLLPQAIVRRIAKRRIVAWQHPEESLFRDGAIMVNKNGQRFCDETDTSTREQRLARQPDAAGWILLDAGLQERYAGWPYFVSTAPQIAYAYVPDYRRLRPDLCTAAADLATLAQRAGMDPASLTAAVAERDATVGDTADDAHGRAPADRPQRGPWLLLGPAYPYITITEGGARIDHDNRVLDSAGEAIAGLYAVGQNGLGGQILFGHGLHIGWAITSGYLVGGRLGAAAVGERRS